MLEVLVTLVVLALMAIPVLNVLVGVWVWGLSGFLVGLVISLAIPLMYWVGLRVVLWE